MRFLRVVLIATIVALLAACSSAPTHYYTLLAMPDAPSSHSAANFQLDVLPVTLTQAADRPQLVVRAGPGKVRLLENHLWIAPLSDEIRSLLSSALTRQLGARDVDALGEYSKLPLYRVAVDIRRFEALPGDQTRLMASWTLQAAADGAVLLACNSRIQEAVGNQVSDVVAAHRAGLLTLATDIGQTLAQLAATGKAVCPVADSSY